MLKDKKGAPDLSIRAQVFVLWYEKETDNTFGGWGPSSLEKSTYAENCIKATRKHTCSRNWHVGKNLILKSHKKQVTSI